MAPKFNARRLFLGFTLLLLISAAFIPQVVYAAAPPKDAAFPDLTTFVASVVDGKAKEVVGVYAQGVFALAVVQQNNAAYVSTSPNTATQFGMAAAQGVVGLLAHNMLGGQYFAALQVGQQIQLVYGDGAIETYWVTQRKSYQATNPTSVHSSFIDLETNAFTDATGLFRQVYTGAGHVTFQTCLEKDGNPNWGRLFIIAERGPAAFALRRPGLSLAGADPASAASLTEYAAGLPRGTGN